MRTILAECIFVIVILASVPTQGAIAILSAETSATATSNEENHEVTSNDPNGAITAASQGTSTSATTSNFSVTSNQGDFSANFLQSRDTGEFEEAYGHVEVRFTISIDSTYEIGGNHSTTASGTAELHSYLYDVTDLQMVFESQQIVIGPATSLSMGGTSGTYILTGNPTGTLLTGHEYVWYGFSSTDDRNADSDLMTVGAGDVFLRIMVPEPSSAIVVLAAIASLALRSRFFYGLTGGG